MAERTIRESSGTWTVRAGGAVLGETTGALLLEVEGSAPVVYFPSADIAMAFLDHTGTDEGDMGPRASYAIVTKSTTIPGAAHSWEDPPSGAEGLKGFIAFGDDERVTVEQI